VTENTYVFQAYREVVALYRRLEKRWLHNLEHDKLEYSAQNDVKLVKEVARKTGFDKLHDYVDVNIGQKGQDSDGIVLLDVNTGEIVGIVPVGSAGDAKKWLQNNVDKGERSVGIRTGKANKKNAATATETVKLTGYVWHGSPILLDLEGLGRPDILAGGDWRLQPGRKLASNALRAFDLDGSGAASWEWVGPRSGILVWDPDGTGKITSGKQLFGNFTWGESFKDGYEALAKLDKDKDGDLDGLELAGLGVWVDADSNGVSDAGEVQTADSLGILSISTKAQRDKAGNASSKAGFTRRTAGGARQTLQSWDWIAMGRAKPTSGLYVWVGEDKGEEIGGYLNLKDDGGEIRGLSFPTISQTELLEYLVALPIKGRVTEPGTLTWSTPAPGGTVISTVSWEDGGKHLYGRTRVDTLTRKSTYDWQAELIEGDPVGAGLRASAAER
jgi:hypothetical protein